MRDNLEVVARPKEVYEARMLNDLVCRTEPETGDCREGPRPVLANLEVA